MNLSDLHNPYVLRPRFLTGAYTAKPGDLCYVDSGTTAITITLPASPTTDTYVGIWDSNNNANANNITIDRNGQTIQGLTDDWVINVDSGRVDLVFDGTTWQVAFITVGGLNQTQVDARIDTKTLGLDSIWIPVEDMFDDTISATPANLTVINTGTSVGGGAVKARSFDDTTQEFLRLPLWWVPNNYDTAYGISFQALWAPAGTDTGDVQWELRATVLTDGDLISTGGAGASLQIADAGSGTANALQITGLPPANSKYPNEFNPGEVLYMYFLRRPDGGLGDDLVGDAKLIGINLIYRTIAVTQD